MVVRYRADRLAVALVLAVFSIQLGLFFFSEGLATWLGMLALFRCRSPVAPSATTTTT